MGSWSRDELEAVAFLGDALGPLFLYEPTRPEVAASIDAFAGLDAASAAAEWPFAKSIVVERAISGMVDSLADGVTDDLLWEYRRLFVGPGKKVAPPWGSVYTDRDRVIFGKSTLDLREWMRAHGVVKRIEPNMPEDHIGYQLVCMAWLAREQPDALDEYLCLHLLTWAPRFLELVERESRHGFYLGLAALARSSLEGVELERELQVETPRYYR